MHYKTQVRRAWIGALALGCAGLLSSYLVPARTTFPGGTLVRVIVGLLSVVFAARLLFQRHRTSIPVLNYHSITDKPAWHIIGDLIAISPGAFEQQLRYLHKHHYTFLTISQMNQYQKSFLHSPRIIKPVVLTFDDGFRDNYLWVFPLLKKYNAKATIFISVDFIHRLPSPPPAPRGYLCGMEIGVMQESGLVEFQAHGVSHTRQFNADRICRFHHPSSAGNIWLYWNLHPERKTLWFEDDIASEIPCGYPLYPQAPALSHKSFFPSASLVQAMIEWAAQHPELWAEPSAFQQHARHYYRSLCAQHQAGTGEWESDESFEKRVRKELRTAKSCIEQLTGKAVLHFCWPENAFPPQGHQWACEEGYHTTVSNFHQGTNECDSDPSRIRRIFVGIRSWGIASPFLDQFHFWLSLRCFQGDYLWYPLLALSAVLKKIYFKKFFSRGAYSSPC